MAANSHSEQHEKPEDWGWHGEFGRAARVAGWVVLLILLVMMTATMYNHSGPMWLIIFAAALFVILIWDMQRRRHSWKK